MKSNKKQVRKQIAEKLVEAAMLHLPGLKKQRQKKIARYVEGKMNSVTVYYTTLLSKKEKSELLSPVVESNAERNTSLNSQAQ